MTYYKLCAGAACAMILVPSAGLANSVKKPISDTATPVRVLSDAEIRRLPSDEDDIIVTASGFRQPIDESGNAITVITRDDLETKQIAILSDILREVPSISIASNGGVGQVSSAFIRGGNSSQTLVLIDGVRLNDPSSPNGAFNFGNLLTGNIGRVEILRGPNSVIWGSQAIGGVINLTTATPTSGFEGQLSAEYGSLDAVNVTGNIAGTSGIISGSIGGGYYRSDGISSLEAGTERDGYENFSANGKLEIALADNISIDLRGYYNRGTVEFDDPFAFAPIFDTFPTARTEQFVGYVGVNADFLDERFRNRIAYTRTDIDRFGEEPGALTFNDNRLRGSIDRFEYHGSLDVAGDIATLVFGLEHERTQASTFFPAGGATAPSIANSNVTSGFGQIILRPASGLTLTGGVRYDDYSLFGGQTTFGGNAAYTPNDGQTVLRATYAEGFRAPTLTESATVFFGNPALTPETNRNFDVGIEHSLLNRAITARATYFNRRSNDQITFSFATFLSENIERVRAEGLELELEIRPTDNFTVKGFYALVDTENRSVGPQFGNRLARRPLDSASISADWSSDTGLSVGGTINLVGDSFDDNGNFTRLDGFILGSVRAAYRLSDNFEAFGRIENLFDSNYQTAARFGTQGRAGYVGVRTNF